MSDEGLQQARTKMADAGVDPVAIDVFEHYYRMVESGDYTWNSGMFIWRLDRVMEEFERQMPELYVALAEVEGTVGTPGYEPTLNRVWGRVVKQAIDYGIMEHAKDVAVIPVDIGWSDVGSWASLSQLLPSDKVGNTVVGNHVGVDTKNTLILGEDRLIATIGVNGLVIVDTEDALLICSSENEQEVRSIVQLLDKKGKKQYL